MQPDEVTALGELAGDAVAGLTGHVRDIHQGIATRVWGSVGSSAVPVREAHDRIAKGVYAAVSGSLGALARTGGRALGARTEVDAPSIEGSLTGRVALGVLNGAFGDKLVERGNALAWSMRLRCHGQLLEPEPPALADAYPDATGRLAVFTHGLCETDEAWKLGSDRHAPYGDRLQAELGYTPVYVRYNTGRHISENGRELAELLERLTDAWPTEVTELALIGHSMGGLVARSACHYGQGRAWTANVRHVFTLGAPHRGAPLEVAAYAACVGLTRLPETRAFANAINVRSAGVKDLGRGYLVDEDWREHDPEAFLTRTGREVPFLRTANHYFVCATLSREPDARLGRAVGDLLVLPASAWAHGGRGHKLQFPVEHYSHLGGANHFDLLNHPAIYDQIRRWLTGRPALPAPAAA